MILNANRRRGWTNLDVVDGGRDGTLRIGTPAPKEWGNSPSATGMGGVGEEYR